MKRYDYIIAGCGAAGLQLALAMSEDSFFQNKRILMIDADDKRANDRTWCWWEQGSGRWDDIITKSWKRADFMSEFLQLRKEQVIGLHDDGMAHRVSPGYSRAG